MNALAGRLALVTGAGRGIGRAIALDLARAGADVIVNYNRSREQAEAVARQIEAMGRRAAAIQADVANKADIDRMFDAAEASSGAVNILVNNAGIEPRADVCDFDEATYDAVMATNLKGAFFCAQRALRKMRDAGWGRVVNVSSLHELTPTGFSALYGMSKGGMALMMREIAKSYSRYGITINNVCPGATRTDINRKVLADPAYEAKVIEKIPAGFIAEPEDIAPTVTFLASDAARYITGTSIFVDGGLWL
ncbi:MAG: glucose 1-dehydrogenase [Pirellulaceae bacterium]|jgi:NAD(P)-dependent dehydrogenase (short-subunit alcohol dehydrogenase family)|nr:glucose 1-dehydrogenase [Thermoguttaceae bacterium]MDI9444056.1 glucose 1-dehydrogenase [Planctomycetota bacterium]NLZ01770.1 glucose 1-dehydrogenase [Pirellulaceae bacterium]